LSYIDVQAYGDEILCWERRKDGELSLIRSSRHDYIYLFMKDNTDGKKDARYTSIYGDPLRKVFFDTPHKLTEFAASHAAGVFESDVASVYKYLSDNYLNADTDAPYNICYFDIEIDFDLSQGLGYPTMTDPFGEINSISVFDVLYQTYVMFIPNDHQKKVVLSDDTYPVKIVWCRSERRMLKEFSDYLDHVDIITGWNSIAFDVNYIMERALILFGEQKAKRLLCRNGVPAVRREFINKYGEEVWKWQLSGRVHLDMMELYKKFHPGGRTSFKLDAVCEDVIGEGKLEYDDNLGELYRTDPQTFYEYSLHDSRLLLKLDNAEKTIQLAMLMARDMCALPKDVTGSVNIINMAFLKFCRLKNNIVLPDIQDVPKEEFEGALVYDTLPGRHSWMMTLDLAALYPSAIILIGMSKENLLYQAKDGYDDYIRIMTKSKEVINVYDEATGDWVELPACDLEHLIRDNGWCISGNATVFDGSYGLLAQFAQEGFDQRVHYKQLAKEASDPELASRYNIYQKVFKIRNNSIYGILSQPAFRMADVRISASTTATGRLISLWQAHKANAYVNQLKD